MAHTAPTSNQSHLVTPLIQPDTCCVTSVKVEHPGRFPAPIVPPRWTFITVNEVSHDFKLSPSSPLPFTCLECLISGKFFFSPPFIFLNHEPLQPHRRSQLVELASSYMSEVAFRWLEPLPKNVKIYLLTGHTLASCVKFCRLSTNEANLISVGSFAVATESGGMYLFLQWIFVGFEFVFQLLKVS